MSAVPCAGLIDEARVTVDISLLERAAAPSPLLAVALLLSLVGVGLAVRAAPTGHRAWSLFTLLAPVGALLGWLSMQAAPELGFACVTEPIQVAGRLVAIGAGLSALAFLQLCVTLTLRAWKKELRVLWPVALLSAALALGGGVAFQKRSLQRDFVKRVEAAMPVPNVRAPQAPPEAHVGRTLAFKPEVEAAGRATGFFFRSRVALGDDDRRSWGLDTVALTPTAVGLTQVPLHLVRDLVTVDVELEVRGVRDEGPAWFPLAKGNRWEFVAVAGRGGVLEKLRVAIARGKKPVPEASQTLEVTGERERDGFHVFEVTVTNQGAEPSVREVLRRDGELFSGGRLSWSEGESCRLGLLEPSWCTCAEDRVTHCRAVTGDVGESLMRLFLGAVTLGLTELRGGMGDLGVGNEDGLLLTRWVVNGQAQSLGLALKPTK